MTTTSKNDQKQYSGYVYNAKEGGFEKRHRQYPHPDELTPKERKKRFIGSIIFCSVGTAVIFVLSGIIVSLILVTIISWLPNAIQIFFGIVFFMFFALIWFWGTIKFFKFFFKKLYIEGKYEETNQIKPSHDSNEYSKYYDGIGDMSDSANPSGINNRLSPLYHDRWRDSS